MLHPDPLNKYTQIHDINTATEEENVPYESGFIQYYTNLTQLQKLFVFLIFIIIFGLLLVGILDWKYSKSKIETIIENKTSEISIPEYIRFGIGIEELKNLDVNDRKEYVGKVFEKISHLHFAYPTTHLLENEILTLIQKQNSLLPQLNKNSKDLFILGENIVKTYRNANGIEFQKNLLLRIIELGETFKIANIEYASKIKNLEILRSEVEEIVYTHSNYENELKNVNSKKNQQFRKIILIK